MTTDIRTVMNPRALLLTIFLLQFLVALDVALLNVALPAIASDLAFTQTGLQWVVNGYLLTFAGLMLLGGRLGDLWGRRRIVVTGLGLFIAFSVIGTVAWSAGSLVAARAGQGVAAALIAPASLALVAANFTEGPLRRRALGLWGMAGAGGGALGVVLSGILVQAFGWRSVLAVNIPIAAVAVFAALRGVPTRERGTAREPLDVTGALLVTAALSVLVYAVAEGGENGWGSGITISRLAVALVLLAAFVLVESRTSHPLMPLRLFRVRSLVGANAFGFLLSAGQLAAFYFCSLYMQQVWGLRPSTAGLLFLPFSVCVVLGIKLAQQLSSVLGVRNTLLVHGLLGAIGLAWFSRMPRDFAFWTGVVGPSLFAAVGIGGCLVLLGGAGTSGVPAHDAGIASGVLNSSRQLGGTIGLAALVTIAADTTSGAGGDVTAALGAGYRAGLGIGAVLLAVGAVLGYLLIPGRSKARD
ncbi:MFS transporter [Nakamurella silvestris]|nr:MFS transporter [Nakamurella silvestris]